MKRLIKRWFLVFQGFSTRRSWPAIRLAKTIIVLVGIETAAAAALRIDAIESAIVLEGFNSGGEVQNGWPVAFYGEGFSPGVSVVSTDPQVVLSPVTVSRDGRVAGLSVTVHPISGLADGQKRNVTLNVLVDGMQATTELTIVGLDELTLTDGSLLPLRGLYSRLLIPDGATVTTSNQESLEHVPNLLITGPLELSGTINLRGKGFRGGVGGAGGSGGTSGGGSRRGYSGFGGNSGGTGKGPFGGKGGAGGSGGSGSSSYSGFSGEQGGPGQNAGGGGFDLLLSPQKVAAAVLPGSGGGGGGGQGGEGGGSGSYGDRGVAGKNGGAGGGSLRLHGLGGWVVDGGRIDLRGETGAISSDRGGSGGNGQNGGLWLTGPNLRGNSILSIGATALLRVDAPPGQAILNERTGGHGPVLDLASIPTVSDASVLTLSGWIVGGQRVRAVITDLSTGRAHQFRSSGTIGMAGSHYTPFTLPITLFGGFNRIELFSGEGLNWIPAAGNGLTRVLNVDGAKSGFDQSEAELTAEFRAKTGAAQPLAPVRTAEFPRTELTEVEPNNFLATANSLGPVGLEQVNVVSGKIDVPMESDFFLFDLPEGVVTLDLQSSESELMTLEIHLLGPSGETAVSYRDWKREEGSRRSIPYPHPAGDFQRAVASVRGVSTGSYTLSLTAELPGKAYLPQTQLSIQERMSGDWRASACTGAVESVQIAFSPDSTAVFKYNNGTHSSTGQVILLTEQHVEETRYAWFYMPLVRSASETNQTIAGVFDISSDSVVFGGCSSFRFGEGWPEPPKLLAQPYDQQVEAGGFAYFFIPATGSGPLTYQWQKHGVDIPGANHYELVFPNVQPTDAGVYRLVVSNLAGIAISNPARLSVTGTGPVIVSEPVSQRVEVGKTVVFSVSATGSEPLSYQWKKDGSDLPGATERELLLKNVQLSSSGSYQVIVVDATGTTSSTPAELTVFDPLSSPIITMQPVGQSAAVGGTLQLAVQASGTPPLFFQWQKDGTNITGAIRSELKKGNIQMHDAGAYRVIVSNAAGAVTSAVAVLTVTGAVLPPSILLHPRSHEVSVGATVTLSVVANGAPPLAFQWHKNGSAIPGATNINLTIKNLSTSDSGSYNVVIHNSAGSASSVVSVLTVRAPGEDQSILEQEPSQRSVPFELPLGRLLIGKMAPNDQTDPGFFVKVEDWYRLELPAETFVEITLKWDVEDSVNLSLFLYPEIGASPIDLSLDENIQSMNPFERLTSFLAPGRYLIGVTSGGSISRSIEYELKAEAMPLLSSTAPLGTWTIVSGLATNYLNSVKFLNGHFIAVGFNGAILTSPNGADWTWRKRQTPGAPAIYTSAFSDGLYVVQGQRGTTMISRDLENWQSVNAVTTSDISVVTSGDGLFVGVTSAGEVLVSQNGSSWSVHRFFPAEALQSITFANGRFVAVGANSTVRTSDDGENWSQHRAHPTSVSLYGVTYGAGQFVVVGFGGKIFTSPDGVSWTERRSPVRHSLSGIAFGEGRYVATGERGLIMTSTDLENWQFVQPATEGFLIEAAFGAGTFVAAGEFGALLFSRVAEANAQGTVSLGIKYGAHPTLTIAGTAGETYRLEYSERLGPGAQWHSVASVTLTTSTGTWTDSRGARSRFYRAVELP